MTVLEAPAILEAAVLNCKKRKVNTPEATAALDVVLAPYVHAEMSNCAVSLPFAIGENDGLDREGQQQVLRAAFPGIRNSVKELIGKHMDALAREFHDTHNIP